MNVYIYFNVPGQIFLEKTLILLNLIPNLNRLHDDEVHVICSL